MQGIVQESGNPEKRTGRMEVPDSTGHSEVSWDKDKPGEVAAAEASFDVLKKKGYVAFKLSASGTEGSQMRTFDPSAERILMRPAMAGG